MNDTTTNFADCDDFGALPLKVRREVVMWGKAIGPTTALKEAGEKVNMTAAMRAAGMQMECSAATARRMYDYARQGRMVRGKMLHGWRALVDWRKVPESRGLPQAFVQHWKKLVENCGANSRQAHKLLLHAWKYSDEPTPGYPISPPSGLSGVPDGWSYSQLCRVGPKKYEKTVARIGRSAADVHRQKIMTTRVGLEVGEFMQFDDIWHDMLVNFVGVNKKAMRPLELCALDLFSGCKFAYGCKPMMEDAETGKRISLRDTDMRFLLVHVLCGVGYRPRGTTLVCEWQTAAITPALEEFLGNVSNGAIRVQRGAIKDSPALLGCYSGQSKGNFRTKAAIESAHQLPHSVSRMLPGQMGSNSRLDQPEELAGRKKVNSTLLKAVAALPAEMRGEIAEALKFPFMEWHQWSKVIDAIYRIINYRTDHKLEGWEKAGLLTNEYRLDEEAKRWLPASSLDLMRPERRAVAMELMSQPGLSRTRKLSPQEVFASGMRGLKKLPISVAPEILGPKLAVTRKVKNDGTFKFQDHTIDSDGLVYLARAFTPQGQEVLLPDGEKFVTYVNPFNVDSLLVCHENGAFIGQCARVQRVCKNNDATMLEAMGAAAHSEVTRLGGFRARHEDKVEQVQSDAAHNKGVLAGVPKTRVQKERAEAHDDLEEMTNAALVSRYKAEAIEDE